MDSASVRNAGFLLLQDVCFLWRVTALMRFGDDGTECKDLAIIGKGHVPGIKNKLFQSAALANAKKNLTLFIKPLNIKQASEPAGRARLPVRQYWQQAERK